MTPPEEAPAGEGPLVLVVDGGAFADEAFVTGLEEEGIRVVVASTGEDGMAQVIRIRPDAVVVGTELPDLPGLVVLRLVREMVRVPLLAISPSDDEGEAVLVLETGAVDVLTRPGRVRENAARIRSAVRSALRGASEAEPGAPEQQVSNGPRTVLCSGPLEVDLDRCEVRVRGVNIHTRPKEFALLSLLVAESGRVVMRERALSTVWPPGGRDKEKSLDVHIRRLRRLVELDHTSPRHIITVRGYGHRFDP